MARKEAKRKHCPGYGWLLALTAATLLGAAQIWQQLPGEQEVGQHIRGCRAVVAILARHVGLQHDPGV
jgi:hypothetical protein